MFNTLAIGSEMYMSLPSFVLGFHGCDASVASKVISGEDNLLYSTNDYDWLGSGIYFWESHPARALRYAQFIKDHPERGQTIIEEPAVVGAVIDIGHCLNLMDVNAIETLEIAHAGLVSLLTSTGNPLPENDRMESGIPLRRRLDCAVIQYVHRMREENNLRKFDAVRGLFVEGPPVYEGAGFHTKNHIQICVINPNCIKGYFYPREPDPDYSIP